MKYWLFKSEKSTWSWQDQINAGEKGTGWDGVRNYQAANNMKAMEIGDRGLFYHSVNDKEIVGIVEVFKLYHPDTTDETGRFGMVSVKAVKPVTKTITLKDIKENPKLENMPLVRQGRLSVSPVTEAEWSEIMRMTETTA